jgi:hypothetical protein
MRIESDRARNQAENTSPSPVGYTPEARTPRGAPAADAPRPAGRDQPASASRLAFFAPNG